MTAEHPGAVAILLAAGSGSRMGGDRPKAFLSIEGRSLLTMAAEAACASWRVEALVVAAPEEWEQRAAALLPGRVAVQVVAGGATRQESVRLALETIGPEVEVVIVHDAARALAPPALFDAVVEALGDEHGVVGAIPVVPVPDTVKRVEGEWVAETVSRDGLVLAQTPQAFLLAPLVDAHRRAVEAGLEFTDDAALVEWAGGRVRTIPGDPSNFKVTTSEDLARAEAAVRSAR